MLSKSTLRFCKMKLAAKPLMFRSDYFTLNVFALNKEGLQRGERNVNIATLCRLSRIIFKNGTENDYRPKRRKKIMQIIQIFA